MPFRSFVRRYFTFAQFTIFTNRKLENLSLRTRACVCERVFCMKNLLQNFFANLYLNNELRCIFLAFSFALIVRRMHSPPYSVMKMYEWCTSAKSFQPFSSGTLLLPASLPSQSFVAVIFVYRRATSPPSTSLHSFRTILQKLQLRTSENFADLATHCFVTVFAAIVAATTLFC